jgi:hypothetical protein
MNNSLLSCTAAGLGAALMYYFDPNLGRRRRSLVRDQCNSACVQMQTSFDRAIRDATNRVQGLFAELRLFPKTDVPDEALAGRIRSKLGRYVSHPHAIEVSAREGHVVLSGPVLSSEVQNLVRAIRILPGVRHVQNQLDVHREAGNVSALQGGGTAPGERWNIAEENWAPGTRLAAVTLGGTMIAMGLTQRFPVACMMGTAGLALFGMAASGQTQSQTNTRRRSSQGQCSEQPLSGKFAAGPH